MMMLRMWLLCVALLAGAVCAGTTGQQGTTDGSNIVNLSDSALSSNVPLKNAANTFTAAQTVGTQTLATNGLISNTAPAAPTAHATLTNHTTDATYCTLKTTAAHGLVAGQGITLAGWTWTTGAINASFHIYDAPTTTTLRIALAGQTGNPTVAGTITPYAQVRLGAAPTVAVVDADCIIGLSGTGQKGLVVQGVAGQVDHPLAVQDQTGYNYFFVTANGYSVYAGDGTAFGYQVGPGGAKVNGAIIQGGWGYYFSGGAIGSVAADVGFERSAANVVKATDGSTGYGNIQSGAVLTAATMTVVSNAWVRAGVTKATWTNAQVVALGAALEGDISVCTLPAKTRVKNAYVIIDSQAAGTTTLTVAVGRTGAAYIDYIVASDAKVAANTVYGDVVGERGTNLTGYDLPSYTGTTTVYAHFVATGANLDQVTTCTGTVVLETETLP